MHCRFCGAPLRHTFVDLGMSPLCESFLPAGAARRRWSRSTRSTSGSASSACSSSSPTYVAARGHLRASTPTSRPTRTSWVEHARRYVEAMIERFGLGPDEPRRRARQQRRLPAPVLRRSAGIPALGIEPAANVAEAAAGARRRRRWSRSSGATLADAAASPRAGRPTWSSATTSSPTCPTSTTSSAGIAMPAGAATAS